MQLAVADADVARSGEQFMQQGSPLLIGTGVVLAHGEMSGLLEDLADTRVIGDALLVNLFDIFTFELANIIATWPQILAIDEKHAYRAFEERLRQRA